MKRRPLWLAVFAVVLTQCARDWSFVDCPARQQGMTCELAPRQCGCEVGERCGVDSTAGMRLCTPSGQSGDGQSCRIGSDCARGFECWGGVCRPFCEPSNVMSCPSGRYCVQVTNQSGGAIPGAGVCFGEQCDPLTSNQCVEGRNCVAVVITTAPTGPVSFTTCIQPGRGVQRSACSNVYGCARGFDCANSTCRRSCRVGHNEDCSSTGQDNTCDRWGVPIVIFGVEYGFCGRAGEVGA